MLKDYQKSNRGKKLIEALISGKIKKDVLSNHGDPFNGAYEQLHYEKFYIYLGSTGRHILNSRLKEYEYDGE